MLLVIQYHHHHHHHIKHYHSLVSYTSYLFDCLILLEAVFQHHHLLPHIRPLHYLHILHNLPLQNLSLYFIYIPLRAKFIMIEQIVHQIIPAIVRHHFD